MKIGFIGLGNMGLPMYMNLLKAGHNVYGFDIIKKNLPELKIVDKLTSAIEDMDVVITMLPDSKSLKSVVPEIIKTIEKRKIFIDCSTVDIQTTKSIAEKVKDKKIGFLDAPVSGGIVGAKEGKLTFMVGGPKKLHKFVKPILQIMGNRIIFCGPTGSGQAAKMCNNLILGVTMISTCETIALADRLGLDRNIFYEVVSTSSGNNWSLSTYCPIPNVGPKTPSDSNYTPGFSSELMLKDLNLAKIESKKTNSNTPMGDLAFKIYKQFVEKEGGRGFDFSAIIKTFEKL